MTNWNEVDHPRVPQGGINGGQFTDKDVNAAALSANVASGARTLDCFDGFLPKYYSGFGFEEYKREANWTLGEPDVVYMRLRKEQK